MDSLLGPLKRNIKLKEKVKESKYAESYRFTKAMSSLKEDVKERQARFASLCISNSKDLGLGTGKEGY